VDGWFEGMESILPVRKPSLAAGIFRRRDFGPVFASVCDDYPACEKFLQMFAIADLDKASGGEDHREELVDSIDCRFDPSV
jgi:hypothetical protein